MFSRKRRRRVVVVDETRPCRAERVVSARARDFNLISLSARRADRQAEAEHSATRFDPPRSSMNRGRVRGGEGDRGKSRARAEKSCRFCFQWGTIAADERFHEDEKQKTNKKTVSIHNLNTRGLYLAFQVPPSRASVPPFVDTTHTHRLPASIVPPRVRLPRGPRGLPHRDPFNFLISLSSGHLFACAPPARAEKCLLLTLPSPGTRRIPRKEQLFALDVTTEPLKTSIRPHHYNPPAGGGRFNRLPVS